MAALRVPLHDLHASLGGSFVPFGAYEMPVRYSSITEEHRAVRESVGLFDVSHMGNHAATGRDAARLLSRATTADVEALADGRCVYTTVQNDDGTIFDDTIVAREGATFHTVPNSGRPGPTKERLEELARRHRLSARVEDGSEGTCIFALQGPRWREVLAKVSRDPWDAPPFRHGRATVAGVGVRWSTTGYTGERGCELFVDAAQGEKVFAGLLEAGRPLGLLPCGLGARDTLRLEMGYCLAGNEFAGGVTPLEAGLAWLVHWDHEFAGRKELLAQKEKGTSRRLVGLLAEDRAIPRHGQAVYAEGERVGEVTSGTQSPTLGKGIALAYVAAARAAPGTRLAVDIRGEAHPATVVKPPFVQVKR